MRAPTFVLSSVLVLAGLTPAVAQLSGGVGSSNAANQSFQQQNTIRGVQQQQTFNNNQVNGQIRSNQLYNNAGSNPGPYVPRRRRH